MFLCVKLSQGGPDLFVLVHFVFFLNFLRLGRKKKILVGAKVNFGSLFILEKLNRATF